MSAAISPVGLMVSAIALLGAVGVGWWYLTHLGEARAEGAADAETLRFRRGQGRRRAVMVAGLVAIAGAFFVGVNFLPRGRGDREAAIFFVSYWTAVLFGALVLLVLAVVDMFVARRFRMRRERNLLGRAFSRGQGGGSNERAREK